MWCPGCLLQWVRDCSDIPLFAMFVGSVSHISVAVRFVCAVRVAVGVWKGVLWCILQRCCSAMVLLCAVRVAVGVLTQWVWCNVCYPSNVFFF